MKQALCPSPELIMLILAVSKCFEIYCIFKEIKEKAPVNYRSVLLLLSLLIQHNTGHSAFNTSTNNCLFNGHSIDEFTKQI